ncbi:hypothetical protein QVL71_07345, partial [Bartonella henselae]|nr:hypothetical protein [Bartonella henselae]MDN0004645.1 hypothetical protein [Bartonella henselae]
EKLEFFSWFTKKYIHTVIELSFFAIVLRFLGFVNFIFHAIIDHILSFQCAESFYIIVVLMIAICCLARLLALSRTFEVFI